MNRKNTVWNHLCSPAGRVRILVGLSLFLMIYGHWIIIGDVFDPLTGEAYNLFTRWVSDFAAKHPEGWWVKASILTFCLGLATFFRRLSHREAKDMQSVWRGFVVLAMASLMIGGLILVAVFDLSPRQYELIESRVILEQARASQDGENEEEPSWWEILLDPKRSTLREELLKDAPLPEEELKPLQERIRNDAWDQEQVLEYLREKFKESTTPEEHEFETLKELKPLPKGSRELSKQWYHRLGFQLFLAGFVLSSIWIAYAEWREKMHLRLPGTLLQMGLTLAFGVWLMIEKLGLAGIPQRALLALIGYWLLRNLVHIGGKSLSGGRFIQGITDGQQTDARD